MAKINYENANDFANDYIKAKKQIAEEGTSNNQNNNKNSTSARTAFAVAAAGFAAAAFVGGTKIVNNSGTSNNDGSNISGTAINKEDTTVANDDNTLNSVAGEEADITTLANEKIAEYEGYIESLKNIEKNTDFATYHFTREDASWKNDAFDMEGSTENMIAYYQEKIDALKEALESKDDNTIQSVYDEIIESEQEEILIPVAVDNTYNMVEIIRYCENYGHGINISHEEIAKQYVDQETGEMNNYFVFENLDDMLGYVDTIETKGNLKDVVIYGYSEDVYSIKDFENVYDNGPGLTNTQGWVAVGTFTELETTSEKTPEIPEETPDKETPDDEIPDEEKPDDVPVNPITGVEGTTNGTPTVPANQGEGYLNPFSETKGDQEITEPETTYVYSESIEENANGYTYSSSVNINNSNQNSSNQVEAETTFIDSSYNENIVYAQEESFTDNNSLLNSEGFAYVVNDEDVTLPEVKEAVNELEAEGETLVHETDYIDINIYANYNSDNAIKEEQTVEAPAQEFSD